MPKHSAQKSRKKYAHNIFRKKTKMRALWSQVKKARFFQRPDGTFGKWTFLKMSKIDFRNFALKKTLPMDFFWLYNFAQNY
jgi:hypothetical protein